MRDALLIVGGIVGFALIVLPTGLIMRGFKNLKETWQGKSNNVSSRDGI